MHRERTVQRASHVDAEIAVLALYTGLSDVYSPLMNGIIFCNQCGTQNSVQAKFCANCGMPFGMPSAPVSPETVAPQPATQPEAVPVYSAPLVTSPAVATRYGGFWMRFVAAVIDGLLLGIVVWPVGLVFVLMVGIAGHRVSMPDVGVHLVSGITVWTLFIGVGWIYEASMESSSKQATVGKMALGLKVTDEGGLRISFPRASARYFGKILSRMTLLIGYIMAGFTARKQALHDMIAGTLVVRAL